MVKINPWKPVSFKERYYHLVDLNKVCVYINLHMEFKSITFLKFRKMIALILYFVVVVVGFVLILLYFHGRQCLFSPTLLGNVWKFLRISLQHYQAQHFSVKGFKRGPGRSFGSVTYSR